MNEPLTKNAVADIKTEFELEREKIQIEHARIALERERLAAERERWQNEAEWRARAMGRMIPVSTLVYVSVICVLVSGFAGWFSGSFVAEREARRVNESFIQGVTAAFAGAGEGTNTVINIQGRERSIRLLLE